MDKTWATATNLDELRHLYQESKNNIDIKLEAGPDSEEEDERPVKKKRKQSDKKESPVKVNLICKYRGKTLLKLFSETEMWANC